MFVDMFQDYVNGKGSDITEKDVARPNSRKNTFQPEKNRKSEREFKYYSRKMG